MSRSAADDALVALSPRLRVLALLRTGIAALPLIAQRLAPEVVQVHPRHLTWLFVVCGVYGVLAGLGELLRHMATSPPRWAIGIGLLVDGAFVGIVLALTGGPQSPLLFLAFAHVAAATLLLSHRTGLTVALWHSLLLVGGPHLIDGIRPPRIAAVALTVTGYWLTALVTAHCSALNERELRRSRSGFQTLSEMAARLGDAKTTADVVGQLLTAVDGYFSGRRFAVFVHHQGARLLTVAVDGEVHDVAVASGPPLDGVIRRCWGERGPVLVRRLDATHDPALAGALPGAHNLVVVPLFVEGEPLGALVAERAGLPGLRIPANLVAMLEQFAAYAALAYRNVALLSEVRRLATVDDLTQLANRRTFEEELAKQTERSARTGEPLTLMLLDIDHFKAINDDHGHQLGDEVLRHVGRALSEGRRPYDLAARYGGEEFAIIMPGADAAAALDVAERLRAAVAADAPLPVTASAGIATLVGPAAQGTALVRAADEALYKAKEGGRDRAVVAHPIGGIMRSPMPSPPSLDGAR